MRLKLTKTKNLPIGVDLGTSSVKMAQMRVSDDGLAMTAAALCEIPRNRRDPPQTRMDFLAGAIRENLKSHPFLGNECILSLPAEATVIQHVKLPKLPPQEIPKALRTELQGKLPFSGSDAIIRHVAAGSTYGDGQEKDEVIAVCCSRKTLDTYLEMAQRARLDVIGVNIEAFAVVECFDRLFRRAADAARTILFVDLGAASTQVVLSQGNRVVFARNLKLAGDQFDDVVAKGLKIPLEQAGALRRDLGKAQGSDSEEELYHLLEAPLGKLTDELTQCLQYYESVFRNQSIERTIFVGGQAGDKRLCQTIAQRLNLPAQIGDPLVRVRRLEGAGMVIGLDRREPQPAWAVAVGLSLGADKAA